MKLVVVGAGAVGGIVAARLHQAGHAVSVVARGANREAIHANGITVHSPRGTDVVHVSVEPAFDGAVILLAVKTHDAPEALRELALATPPSTPIVCLANGIAAERMAARWFERVYGCCVYTPATHLEPGVVEAWGEPVAGLFDVGRFPDGADDTCHELARAFDGAGLSSRALDDIMRWKRGKLLFNLTNALEALCGSVGRTHAIAAQLRDEAVRCYEAAGLAWTREGESTARLGDFRAGTIAGRARSGGSTWQSLARGMSTLECEYLNGEIALLGRLHGVATPVNDAVLRAVTRAAANRVAPGALSIDAVIGS